MSDNDPSAADPFGQIADEFVEAFRQGKQPSVEEFARRYPAHADEIREMLPALVLMEKAKAEDDTTGSVRQAAAASAAAQIQQLGDYQILREVGRGGMGVVYEAQQLSLGRHVTIKVLPSHALLDPRHVRRFEREARSAARLHHTNIVPVYGVGEQDGVHYYVMQFIQGLGLDVVLHELRRLRQPHGKWTQTRDDAPGRPTGGSRDLSAVAVARSLLTGMFRPLDSAEATQSAVKPVAVATPESPGSAAVADTSATIRLPGQTDGSTLTDSGSQYWQSVARIGVQVSDALSHAASQGVLHRDIKPSNLLLDETGNVWVTDFGLAKADSDGDNLTHTGDIVGTMRYMAPERFNGQGDLRSDLYSLGLTLYELLVLRPAFDESDRNKLFMDVMHGEPVRPRKLNRAVPRDLETVVLKAIARHPSHRYQSPTEMADDLKRVVEDRPVKARRVSELEKFVRWCRRNPLPAGLLAGIVVVFLLGFGGALWQWRAAVSAREDEKDQRNRAEALRQNAERARDEARQREGEAVAARDEAKKTRNEAARQAAGLLLDRGIEDARAGEPARALHLFVRALRALTPDDPQAAPLGRVIRANLSAWAETVPALEHIFADRPKIDHVAFSPDGAVVAVAFSAGEVQSFQTDTGRRVGPAFEVPAGSASAMTFSADGRSLWVGASALEKVVDQWRLYRVDPASGRSLQPPLPTAGPVYLLFNTPDNRYLVGSVMGLHPEERGSTTNPLIRRKWRTASITVWEAASGRVVRKVEVNAEIEYDAAQRAGPDTYLGLSPDGKSVTAWIERGSTRYEGLTFSVGGNEPPIRFTPPALGPKAAGMLHFPEHMQSALAIKDGQLHRWSAAKPGEFAPGIPAPFRSMHDSPSADGRSVFSPVDGRYFDIGTWPPRATGVRFTQWDWQVGMEQSPDGRFTMTWNPIDDCAGRLWRMPRSHSRPALSLVELSRQLQRVEYHLIGRFDPHGASAALWGKQRPSDDTQANDITHDVRIVDVATGAVRGPAIRHGALVRDVVFSPDGRYFATASFDTTARVWETATGRPAGPALAHTNFVATVAFSPDGNTLAAGDYGPAGLVKLWNWRTGKEVRPPLRHDDILLGVSYSPDARYLAVIKTRDWSNNPELLIWDVASGTVAVRMRYVCPSFGHLEMAQFRRDGRACLARDLNGVLRLWEIPSGKLLGERPLAGAGWTRFSPDGRVIAAAANLGVRLLDGDTLAPLSTGYLPSASRIADLVFSPDGAFLLTAHETGSAQLWDVATCKPVGPPAVLVGPIRSVAFTPDGKTCLCVAADGTVRRWPVPTPFAEAELARLDDRLALMTCLRLAGNQGLEFVSADEWLALRAKPGAEGSTALIPPRPVADWHDAAAADAEQDVDTFGAVWHLDRLAAARPDDWTLPARRGRVLAAAGRRDEADAAYAAARRLAPSPQVLSDWLRAVAADHEAAGRKEEALWNLNRAVALTPGDWTLYVLRANLDDPARVVADEDEAIRLGAEPDLIEQAADRAAGVGNWKRTATLLTKMARDPDLPMSTRYAQAIACLRAGDTAGYRSACDGLAAMLPRCDPKMAHHESNRAARASALGPNGSDDWPRSLSWMEKALARLAEIDKAQPNVRELVQRERHRFLATRGAVLYRAGRFEDAAKVLREAMSLHTDVNEFFDCLFLALAEYRLGHAEAAKQAAAKARAVPKLGSPWENAEVEILGAELDSVLPAGK
jgi:serine/threonine protein kinase/WD40 repeat protein/predicted Zn-dependent protease